MASHLELPARVHLSPLDQAILAIQNGSEDIDLSQNALTDGDLAQLARALEANMSRVQKMDLSRNNIQAQGLLSLSNVLRHTQISFLNLDNNRLDQGTLRTCMPGLVNSALTQLVLDNNMLDDYALEEISRLCESRPLLKLGLYHNSFYSLDRLATSLANTRLTELDVGGNQLATDGIRQFIRALRSSHITSLDLRYNVIDTDGAQEIADILKFSKLRSLNLSGNGVGDDGASFLAIGVRGSQLESLNLEANAIGDVGAIAFSQVLPESNLEILELYGNTVTDTGAERLCAVVPRTRLTTLTLLSNQVGSVALLDRLDRVLDINRSRQFPEEAVREHVETRGCCSFCCWPFRRRFQRLE